MIGSNRFHVNSDGYQYITNQGTRFLNRITLYRGEERSIFHIARDGSLAVYPKYKAREIKDIFKKFFSLGCHESKESQLNSSEDVVVPLICDKIRRGIRTHLPRIPNSHRQDLLQLIHSAIKALSRFQKTLQKEENIALLKDSMNSLKSYDRIDENRRVLQERQEPSIQEEQEPPSFHAVDRPPVGVGVSYQNSSQGTILSSAFQNSGGRRSRRESNYPNHPRQRDLQVYHTSRLPSPPSLSRNLHIDSEEDYVLNHAAGEGTSGVLCPPIRSNSRVQPLEGGESFSSPPPPPRGLNEIMVDGEDEDEWFAQSVHGSERDFDFDHPWAVRSPSEN